MAMSKVLHNSIQTQYLNKCIQLLHHMQPHISWITVLACTDVHLMVDLFFLSVRADECMGVMPRRWNQPSWLPVLSWPWSSTLRNPAGTASRSLCWMEAKVRMTESSKNKSAMWRPQGKTIILSLVSVSVCLDFCPLVLTIKGLVHQNHK